MQAVILVDDHSIASGAQVDDLLVDEEQGLSPPPCMNFDPFSDLSKPGLSTANIIAKQLDFRGSGSLIAVSLMALFVSMPCHASKTNGIQAENNKEKGVEAAMSEESFRLSTEDYFTSPTKNSPEVGRRLIRNGFQGLLIEGPGYIATDKWSKFPIVAMRIEESMESSLHLFKEYALITAVDLHSGKLHVGYFAEQKFVEVKRDLEKFPPPPGMVSDGGATDLFPLLGLPKHLGEYLVTAILLGKQSNRIRVKVGPSAVEEDGIKFDKALKAFRNSGEGHNFPSGSERAISPVQEPNSPLIPEAPGVTLRVEARRKSKLSPVEVILYGSYHLENASLVAKADVQPGGIMREGFVPITLLGTGTRIPAPIVLELNVSPHPKPQIQAADGIPSKGFFSVKMDRMNGIEGNQTYYFRAFSGSQLSDPVELKLSAD